MIFQEIKYLCETKISCCVLITLRKLTKFDHELSQTSTISMHIPTVVKNKTKPKKKKKKKIDIYSSHRPETKIWTYGGQIICQKMTTFAH